MLLSYDELDNAGHERNDDVWTNFGEPNVYPQFVRKYINWGTSNTDYGYRYYERTEAGMISGAMF